MARDSLTVYTYICGTPVLVQEKRLTFDVRLVDPEAPPCLAGRGPTDSAPFLAAMSVRLSAAYDCLRLSLYRDKGPRGHLISIASIGSATLLRFEDVGYFNRVYVHDDAVVPLLESIERFFRGSRHGCRMVAPPFAAGTLASVCESRGWLPDEEYAWLAARNLPPPPNTPNDFEIRPPRADEQDLFLHTYLTGFGADPRGHAMAIENMRHLFLVPDLHFLFAFRDGRPAGIGMMYCTGDSALLCGGATLPSHRIQGCHEALLAARIGLAHDLACKGVYAYALAGGQSQTNMESAGLRTVGTTRVMRFPPAPIA
jgi:hypothetical protein